jgi:hypothetical protein
MSNRYMDDTTFEILYKNLCMGVSQEELARLYSHDNRYNTQGKISKCVIEHGFHTGVHRQYKIAFDLNGCERISGISVLFVKSAYSFFLYMFNSPFLFFA